MALKVPIGSQVCSSSLAFLYSRHGYRHYGEQRIVVLPTGRLVALRGGQGESTSTTIYTEYSDDGGLTWTTHRTVSGVLTAGSSVAQPEGVALVPGLVGDEYFLIYTTSSGLVIRRGSDNATELIAGNISGYPPGFMGLDADINPLGTISIITTNRVTASNYQIRHYFGSIGGWSNELVADYPSDMVTNPSICIGGGAGGGYGTTIHVLWNETALATLPKIHYSQKPLAGVWSAIEDVDTGLGGFYINDSAYLVADHFGNAHILSSVYSRYYEAGDGPTNKIAYRKRQSGGAWDAWQIISGEQKFSLFSRASASVDVNGKIFVRWCQSEKAETLMLPADTQWIEGVESTDGGTTFNAPHTIAGTTIAYGTNARQFYGLSTPKRTTPSGNEPPMVYLEKINYGSTSCIEKFVWTDFVSEPPYVDQQNPGNGDTGVLVVSNIEFHLKDNTEGVDPDSVTIEVDFGSGFQMVYQNQTDVGGHGVTTRTGTANDYLFSFNPALSLPYSTLIQVRVNAQDQAVPPDVMVPAVWSFTTEAAVDDPIISNLLPINGTTQVAYGATLGFDITDANGNLLQNTIQFTITERPYGGSDTTYNVVVNGAASDPNWNVTITVIPNGFRYHVTKIVGLSPKTRYICNAYGEDAVALSDEETWSFWTTWTDAYDYDIYVDSANGSDLNSGVDWNNSLATIEEAISRLHPGRTIWIAAGKGYTAPVDSETFGCDTITGWILQGVHSGSPGAETKIKAKPNEQVVLNIPSGRAFHIWWAHDIQIEGWFYSLGSVTLAEKAWHIRNSQRIRIDKTIGQASYFFDLLSKNLNECSGPEFGLPCEDILIIRSNPYNCNHSIHADADAPHTVEYEVYHMTTDFTANVMNPIQALTFSNSIVGQIIGAWTPTVQPSWSNNNSHPTILALGANNTNVDSLFYDKNVQDYRLRNTSPMIDQGLVYPGINDWYFGTAPDRGAFENLAINPAGFADSYVDSLGGNDSNTGTGWGDAFATLSKGIYNLAPGGTLHVRHGVGYFEKATLTSEKSGIISNPTEMLSDHPDGITPVIQQPVSIFGDYIHVIDFEVRNPGRTVNNGSGAYNVTPSFFIANSQGGWIDQCVASDLGSTGVKNVGFQLGYSHAAFPTTKVRDCKVTRSVAYGNAIGARYDIHSAGTYLGNKFYNLTLDSNNYAGLCLGQILQVGINSIEIKNLSVSNNGIGMSFGLLGTSWDLGVDFDSDYNNVYGNISQYAPSDKDGANSLNKPVGLDPQYVGSPNYHLLASSPNIDAGIDVGLPYYGLAPDIGAYEYSPILVPLQDVTQWWAHIY